MRIAVRVDASTRTGTGHLMRCLALANEVRALGGSALFISRADRHDLLEQVESSGHTVQRLPAVRGAVSELDDVRATAAALDTFVPDWLVVDHYDLGGAWETCLRTDVKRILAIDDLERAHNCDVLLDQNWYGERTESRYSYRLPAECRKLLGPRYALLHPEYARLAGSCTTRRQLKTVLVSFGSADHTNETAKALRALARPEFRHLHVNVVLGPNHADPPRVITAAAARPNTTVHYAPESLADLMMTADFAFGAAGTTIWERLCLMLPSAVTVTASNQTEIARCLAADGYINWIGFAAETTAQHYATALANANLSAPDLPRLVDGLGARRCVEFMAATMREKRIRTAP